MPGRLALAFGAAALFASTFLNWFPGRFEGAYFNRSNGAPAYSGIFSASAGMDAWQAFSAMDILLAALAAAVAVAALVGRPAAIALLAAVAVALAGVVLYESFNPPTEVGRLLGPGAVVAFGSLVLIAAVGAFVAGRRGPGASRP